MWTLRKKPVQYKNKIQYANFNRDTFQANWNEIKYVKNSFKKSWKFRTILQP